MRDIGRRLILTVLVLLEKICRLRVRSPFVEQADGVLQERFVRQSTA